MQKTIYANGSAEVLIPKGQKIAIATYGNDYATISFKRGNNLEFVQRLDNDQVILGAYADNRTVVISASSDAVFYSVAEAPFITDGRSAQISASGNNLIGISGEILPLYSAFDIVVYGATASGIMAAIAAKKQGKKALIVDPTTHIGGMVTGGVSYTDVYGNDYQILKDEVNTFYADMAAIYDKDQPTFWSESYNGAPATSMSLLMQRIQSYGIQIVTGRSIKRTQKIGTTIAKAVFELSESPSVDTDWSVSADVFIDASYEGDLLAKAGCSYTVGREDNATYTEIDNGVRVEYTNGWSIDPYVTEGVSGSGLLPGIIPGPLAATGSADSKVQAYSYRVHVTTGAGKRPFTEPQTYNPLNYEILGRLCAAGNITTLTQIFVFRAVKDGLFDMNNGASLISLDYVGGSWTYPLASAADRATIIQAHKDYTLGLFKFLREDSRVPAGIKASLATYGLAPVNQFDTVDGLPPQLYVREARRMVSDFVENDRHCRNILSINDGICIGVYPLDSHHVQRFVNSSSKVALEGEFFDNQGRFWISYGAIVPKTTQCTNLLVTFAISASHAAFSSIRMEPQAMMMGVAAGYAAALAIDGQVSVQSILARDLRVLMGFEPANSIVVDVPPGATGTVSTPTGSVTVTGSWTEAETLSAVTDASIYGPTFLSDGNAGKGTKSIVFAPNVATAGLYNVYAYFPHAASRATNTPVSMTNNGTAKNVTLNQTQDGRWKRVGAESYYFRAGSPSADTITISNTGTSNFVMCDAFALVPA